ncbi:MAG: site-specific integrase [Anaerolineales bacterium]|nr:site-specific integrase [Anaerolineales bacterium]
MLSCELDDFERFLDEKTWSPTTITMYRRLIKLLSKWMDQQGIQSFGDLTIRHAKEFVVAAKWGNSLIRKLNSVLLQFMRWKFGEEHNLARWRVRREVSPPQRTLNENMVGQLLSSFQPGISDGFGTRYRRFGICDTDQPLGKRNLAIIWMMLDTGFRCAEICNLELSNLDLANHSATGLVKFGRWRTARFSAHTAQVLANWLEVRPARGPHVFTPVMNTKQRMTEAGMRNMFRKLGLLSGIGPFSPHDLRRTFATLSIRNGASLQAVKEAGGWKNTEMVLHYTRAITGEEIVPFLPGNVLVSKAQNALA